MTDTPILVWDFDGVLNANTVDGRFVWADRLAQDWGVDKDAMAAHIFAPRRIGRIMRGQMDLRDAVTAWRDAAGHDFDVDDFLAYWFDKDAHPDAEVLAHLARPDLRHVIGTNNATRRTAYIETEMGLGAHVEHIFASGRMGCAKPDGAYFARIEAWSGAPRGAHVLVDDAARNIDAAAMRGWQVFHFTDATRDALSAFLDDLS